MCWIDDFGSNCVVVFMMLVCVSVSGWCVVVLIRCLFLLVWMMCNIGWLFVIVVSLMWIVFIVSLGRLCGKLFGIVSVLV